MIFCNKKRDCEYISAGAIHSARPNLGEIWLVITAVTSSAASACALSPFWLCSSCSAFWLTVLPAVVLRRCEHGRHLVGVDPRRQGAVGASEVPRQFHAGEGQVHRGHGRRGERPRHQGRESPPHLCLKSLPVVSGTRPGRPEPAARHPRRPRCLLVRYRPRRHHEAVQRVHAIPGARLLRVHHLHRGIRLVRISAGGARARTADPFASLGLCSELAFAACWLVSCSLL